MRQFVLPLLILSCSNALFGEVVNFRGDGQGHAPADVQLSDAYDIVWQAPLPEHGNGSPIVIQGQAYVVCDPGHRYEAPVLVAVDATSGEELWQTPIDHFDLLPDAAEAKALRKRFWEVQRLAGRLKYEANHGGDIAAIKKQAEAAGIGVEESKGRWRMDASPRSAPKDHPSKRIVKEYGWPKMTWGQTSIGATIASPVADAKRVYLSTAFKTVAAVGHDGQLAWLRWFKDEEYPSHDTARFVHSPLLVGDTLIVHANRWLRAFDVANGKTRWELETDMWLYQVGTPIHLDLDGTEVVFTASGEVVRITDGKPLATGIGQFGGGSGPVAIGPDIIYGSNGSTGGHYKPGKSRRFNSKDLKGGIALRLTLKGDGVEVEQVWHNAEASAGEPTPVFLDGHIFLGAKKGIRAVDAATGAVTGQAKGARTKHALIAGGGLIFTQDNYREIGVYRAAPNPGLVTKFTLPYLENLDEAKKAQVIAITGGRGLEEPGKWGSWNTSHAVPFPSGNRLFVRTFDALYCLGQQGQPTRLSSAHR